MKLGRRDELGLPGLSFPGPARDRAPEIADGALDETARKGHSLLVEFDLNSSRGEPELQRRGQRVCAKTSSSSRQTMTLT